MSYFIPTRLLILTATLVLCVYSATSDVSDLDWWQKSVIYQIYPRSFKDTDEDGIGDIKGIEEQLSYFQYIGVNMIWLSPVYKSPMFDMGYDISNFTDIDPLFGTMADFDNLVKKCKEFDIKVLMDFVPNHSSDQCEWFKKSVQKIDPYTDYYVWQDPKGWTNNGTTPIPPNNWVSVFQGPAWNYSTERKQFYLHQFAPQQPDLNYRSPHLVNEIKDALRFWLDRGVDGFRVDSIMYLFENASFPDEEVITDSKVNGYPEYYYAVNHTYTINQPETYRMAAEFRELLDSYKQKDGKTRLMMTEAYTSLENTLRYYGTPENPIAHFPFNFFLLKNLNFTSKAKDFQDYIEEWLQNMPKNAWPNWVFGNHDNFRIASRFAPELVDGINMLSLLLPGTPITYQGEEIGMEDMKIRWDQTTDIQALIVGEEHYEEYSRDPVRTPFQWNSSSHSGFSRKNGKTWLPVNPNYYYLNVENQKRIANSHLNIYKATLKLRSENAALQKGEFEVIPVGERVFTFKRFLPGQDVFIIIINLSNEEEYVTLNNSTADLPSQMNIVIASQNSEHNLGDSLPVNETGFKMRPYSALVLQAAAKHDTYSHSYYTSAGSSKCVSVALFLLAILRIF